jgi:hypothetical protein
MTSGLSGIKSEDDVLDIAKTMVPQTKAPKSVVPQSPLRPPAPSTAEGAPGPMFFGSSGSGVTRFDPNSGRSVGATVPNAGRLADPRAAFDESSAASRAEQDARRGQIDVARDAAKQKARAEVERQKEITDKVDYNRDGKIGGQNRPMTEEELINSIGRGFLEPIDNTQARGAADEALQQRNAENRANVRARLGVAGMGLSGAAGAAEGTEGRRGERERVLAMDEFDRGARKEQAERYLTGIGVSRESEVFKKLMEILDKENAPDADPVSPDTGLPEDPEARNEAASKLQLRGRGMSGMPPFHTPDPYVSGPHVIDGQNNYVYRRQDNGELYRSRTPPDQNERAQESSTESGGDDAEFLTQFLGQYGINT